LDDQLRQAMAELDEDKVLSLVGEKIKLGSSAMEIVECCRQGVEEVGKKYSDGEYFLSDLVMSKQIFSGIMKIVEPYIPASQCNHRCSIVIGTIEGDIHDLGKDIMIYLLRSYGFKVYDLGIDVPPEKFVQAVNETGTSILGISVLLSFCVGSVKKVVELLEESGLREKVKIIVGGYQANPLVKEFSGADFYADNVAEALKILLPMLRSQDD